MIKQPKENKMKISTSTGDFSGYVKTIAEKVKLFKDTKFKYINLEQTGSEVKEAVANDKELKRKIDDWGEAAVFAGITYVVSHAPCINPFGELTDEHYRTTVRIMQGSIEACRLLGIDRIVVHAGENEAFTISDFYKRNREYYLELADIAEKYGITVMTENMVDYTYNPLSTGREMREFIEYVNHPLIAGCWDTAHANNNRRAKIDGQYKCIVDLGDRLKGLHIADNFGDGPHHHTWPFAGVVNFDSVMQGLIDGKYDGFFNFEASYTLLHNSNLPYHREPWVHNGETVTKLLNPSVELKQKAVDLMYYTGKYILEAYDQFEE